MDNDFLISHGPGLTWMDVKIGDYYPTPRAKKAVEIQALWYNALIIMSKLASFLEKEDIYFDTAKSVKNSFVSKYDQQYDLIDTKDLSVRPNKLFLVSTDFIMINLSLQKKIIKDIEKNLLTIFGLRTLNPKDPRYMGYYIGSHNRDISYHNGIAWPWLLGHFIKAYVKINKYSQKSRKYAFNEFIKPMLEVYGDDWDGSINEIFDGEPVYEPNGCITQAWSVAEILRCCIEDIENISPIYKEVFESHKIRV
jgi:glycogen debranching enzyme